MAVKEWFAWLLCFVCAGYLIYKVGGWVFPVEKSTPVSDIKIDKSIAPEVLSVNKGSDQRLYARTVGGKITVDVRLAEDITLKDIEAVGWAKYDGKPVPKFRNYFRELWEQGTHRYVRQGKPDTFLVYMPVNDAKGIAYLCRN